MELEETKLSECYVLKPLIHTDMRGSFVKTVNAVLFDRYNLSYKFKEQYYSSSIKNVLRGLHFQIPPHEHIKLVTCVYGEILDVVIDLRNGAPTYGQHIKVALSSDNCKQLYIPSGMAHGYCVLSDIAIVHYNLTSEYAPDHDSGILWSSAGVKWPVSDPIISDRDRALQHFGSFASPF